MNLRSRKNPKKIDLLEVPEAKRVQLIKEVKETLKEKIIEAKLWKSLVEIEDLNVNGDLICMPNGSLSGKMPEANLWKL
jgi:SET domain-containing protein